MLEDHIDEQAVWLLLHHSWPENIRQLEGVFNSPGMRAQLRAGRRFSRSKLEGMLGQVAEVRRVDTRNHSPGINEFPADWTYRDFKQWLLAQRRQFCEQAVARHGGVKQVCRLWPDVKKSTLYTYLEEKEE